MKTCAMMMMIKYLAHLRKSTCTRDGIYCKKIESNFIFVSFN